jgi:hypothetical protein
MDKTIEMAREAGFTDGELAFMGDNFRRFAELVRADEREHSLRREKFIAERWKAECNSRVEIEREACAKLAATTVCDTHIPTNVKIYGTVAAKAIRDRGNV